MKEAVKVRWEKAPVGSLKKRRHGEQGHKQSSVKRGSSPGSGVHAERQGEKGETGKGRGEEDSSAKKALHRGKKSTTDQRDLG